MHLFVCRSHELPEVDHRFLLILAVCSSRGVFNSLHLAGYTLGSISSIAVLPHVLLKFHFLISHQERKMKSYFPWKNFHFSDSHLVICDQICVHFCLPWRAFFEDRNLTYSITYSSNLQCLFMFFLHCWIFTDPE